MLRRIIFKRQNGMKLFVVSCSLRQGALNHKLASHIGKVAEAQGHEVDLARINDFDMPLYNFDIQESEGFPAASQALVDRILAADGWVVTSPEYNWSVPAAIKNAIDWVSRMRPMPIAGRSVLLSSASPSMVGGVRGLLHFRQTLEQMGIWTYPKVFALAQASAAFDEDGGLVNADLAKMLDGMVADYCSAAVALNNR